MYLKKPKPVLRNKIIKIKSTEIPERDKKWDEWDRFLQQRLLRH
jgi:hypothetical protein